MEHTVKLVAGEIRKNIQNPQFDAMYKKYKTFNIWKIVTFSLSIISIITLVFLGAILQEPFPLLIIFVLAVIFVIAAVVLFSLTSKLSKKLTLEVDNIDWNMIYQKAFTIFQKNTVVGLDFKKVEFKELTRIKNVNTKVSVYEEPQSWIHKYDFLVDERDVNYIEMKYEDKYLFFKVNPTIKCIVIKHYTDSKGKSQTRTEYHYITTYNLAMENTKFDDSYNGLKVLPGKSKGEYFQTESIEFNRKFKINLKSTDLKAAKFLRPKMIESMMDLSNKDFNGLAIKKDFIVGKYNIDSGYSLRKITNQIAVFDKMSKSSKHGPTYNFAKKVINDIAAIADCFKYVEGIY